MYVYIYAYYMYYIYYITREMKLTSIFFRNGRQPQNENKVPFKALLPLKLRDFVSSKNVKTTGIFKELFSFFSIIFQLYNIRYDMTNRGLYKLRSAQSVSILITINGKM